MNARITFENENGKTVTIIASQEPSHVDVLLNSIDATCSMKLTQLEAENLYRALSEVLEKNEN